MNPRIIRRQVVHDNNSFSSKSGEDVLVLNSVNVYNKYALSAIVVYDNLSKITQIT